MALTEAQLARIRRLIGDEAEAVFTDDELDAIYTDADEELFVAVVECFDVLLANAAKRVSYRQGQSFEDDNKLFEHLEKLRASWAKRAGVGEGAVMSEALTFTFYDNDADSDGTGIPFDEDDDYGWLLN